MTSQCSPGGRAEALPQAAFLKSQSSLCGQGSKMPPLVSVIVPIFDSADLIGACQSALAAVIDGLPEETEIIYVDDGSRDNSLEALRLVQAGDPRVRIVELAANYGQHAALLAGIERARGQAIVTMDVDLQCDPKDISRLLAALADGHDLVCGVRVGRADPAPRRLLSLLMSTLVRRLSGVSLRDAGCSFNALTQELGLLICNCGELRRFGKPLAARMAKRIAEVEIRHAPRPPEKRRSSYSATRLVRLFMDFFVAALGDVFGWVFVVASAMTVVFAAAALIGLAASAISGRDLVLPLVLGSLCGFSGLTALMALTAEYMQRIYRQSSGAPMYMVRRMHEPVRDSL
jgi:undecaprenyl-phosphate 4-deoxy-4-formamido-L-arabinose transferase